MTYLVNRNKNKHPSINIYEGVIHEEDNKEVTFNISNNGQSSSILSFGTHSIHHPRVYYIHEKKVKTIRLDTLIENNNIPIQYLNFLNLDIQGVELSALKSMGEYLNYVDYIYTEINTEEVYKECCLVNEIDKYLQYFGFTRVETKICENFGWGDALYIKNTI
jgi:FkbM family methyltransferase